MGSYLYFIGINYQSKSRNLWNVQSLEGIICLKWSDSYENDAFWNPFEYEYGSSVVAVSSDDAYQVIGDDSFHQHLLGFFVDKNQHYILLTIPFWFLTTLAAALLWWVWRKTRPNAKGRAFPVELAKPSSVQSSKAE